MTYNNGNWKINYSKVADKRKRITLYSCSWCKGKGTETFDISDD